MDIEEAKVILKEFNEDYEEENGIGDLAEGIAEMVVDWNDNEAIETVLSELDKKDTIINLMAKQLAGIAIWNNEKEEPLILMDKQEVIDYFANKVEEDRE